MTVLACVSESGLAAQQASAPFSCASTNCVRLLISMSLDTMAIRSLFTSMEQSGHPEGIGLPAMVAQITRQATQDPGCSVLLDRALRRCHAEKAYTWHLANMSELSVVWEGLSRTGKVHEMIALLWVLARRSEPWFGPLESRIVDELLFRASQALGWSFPGSLN